MRDVVLGDIWQCNGCGEFGPRNFRLGANVWCWDTESRRWHHHCTPKGDPCEARESMVRPTMVVDQLTTQHPLSLLAQSVKLWWRTAVVWGLVADLIAENVPSHALTKVVIVGCLARALYCVALGALAKGAIWHYHWNRE